MRMGHTTMIFNMALLALIASFALSATNLIVNRCSAKFDEYIITWSKYLFALPLLWIILFIEGFPKIENSFWMIIILMMPLEIAIALLTTKALRVDVISKVIPFTSFTPLFIGIIASLLLKEHLSSMVWLVIVLFVIGTYILNLEKGDLSNLFAPFQRLTKERQVLYILLASLLIGFTVSLGKLAILRSSAVFFTAVYFLCFTIVFTPIYLKKSDLKINSLKLDILPLILIGVLNSIYFLTSWLSTKYGPVALANTLASTNILFTMIVAGTFFNEKGLGKRLTGACIMLAAAILIIADQQGLW